MNGVKDVLADAIAKLYADAPIVGDPDLLDYAGNIDRGVSRGA